MCVCLRSGRPPLFLEISIWQVWLSITSTGETYAWLSVSRCVGASQVQICDISFILIKHTCSEVSANIQLVFFNSGLCIQSYL